MPPQINQILKEKRKEKEGKGDKLGCINARGKVVDGLGRDQRGGRRRMSHVHSQYIAM